MTVLRQAIDSYLELRRSLGFKLKDNSRCLRNFGRFLEERNADYLTTSLALEWATEPREDLACTWAKRLGYVRGFAEYWSATDPRTEIPDKRLLPYSASRPQPHIYSDDEVQRLLDAAKSLTARGGLRPHTYYCVFGLLAVTGLRASEVLNLERGDVDFPEGVLTIRQTKFGKNRLVPVHPSTGEKLAEYAARRDAWLRTISGPFFVNEYRRRLSYTSLITTFRQVGTQAGLWKATDQRKPRLHDLRHTLAVNTLIAWYQAGEDVERRMPALSAFLGHGRVEDTYWYLSLYPELRKLAADRFEKRWEGSS
ncbi:MAG: tyrosine-type recombinase/integrase [Terriglobia bacterium]